MEIPQSVQFALNFVHPLVMWLLFAFTLYSMYLGIQIRRTRAADSETRKTLIKGGFNFKHYQAGSLLLAFMVIGTIGGMAATYMENHKLFFSPHLLVGLGMTAIVAVSASLSPYMQKGHDWARNLHIALNVGLVGLFAWQAITGMNIVQKLLSKA